MINFIVYETKIKDNKLTFEYWDSFDEYDDAVKVTESNPNTIVVPFDTDDDDDPESYYKD